MKSELYYSIDEETEVHRYKVGKGFAVGNCESQIITRVSHNSVLVQFLSYPTLRKMNMWTHWKTTGWMNALFFGPTLS